MNRTEANPIPKLLTVPIMELNKSGIKLKLNLELILASLKSLDESMPWLSRYKAILLNNSRELFSIAVVFKRDKFSPWANTSGINMDINPKMSKTKMINVAMVAKIWLNLSFLLKKSKIGFPIKVKIKATTK